MLGKHTALDERIERLQSHLERENPILLDVVKSFRALDRVAYRLGILERSESFATRVPWWPMVAVMGMKRRKISKLVTSGKRFPTPAVLKLRGHFPGAPGNTAP